MMERNDKWDNRILVVDQFPFGPLIDRLKSPYNWFYFELSIFLTLKQYIKI